MFWNRRFLTIKRDTGFRWLPRILPRGLRRKVQAIKPPINHSCFDLIRVSIFPVVSGVYLFSPGENEIEVE